MENAQMDQGFSDNDGMASDVTPDRTRGVEDDGRLGDEPGHTPDEIVPDDGDTVNPPHPGEIAPESPDTVQPGESPTEVPEHKGSGLSCTSLQPV